MFGSEILDVAIGILFVFLVTSLLCSAVSELVASYFKFRARDLERGISELVGDAKNQKAATDFVRQLYEHGLINGLFKGTYDESKNPTRKQKLLFQGYKLPAYIPSRNFALALLDILQTTPHASLPANLQTSLRALEIEAGGDLEKGRKSIEAWYDSGMDRVSGWYKQRTQVILVIIGFLLALAINIDTVEIAKSLAKNSVLRKSLVAAAEGYQKNPGGPVREPAQIEQSFKDLKDLDLPVCVGCRWMKYPDTPGDERRKWWVNLWTGALGYLITAAAVSFGAPFWFDVLNKFIVVRSTVKPKEKSPEEPSKDAK